VRVKTLIVRARVEVEVGVEVTIPQTTSNTGLFILLSHHHKQVARILLKL
jgi:hypothetical protein